jgi:DNA-binding CsgD family transcriptional regulator
MGASQRLRGRDIAAVYRLVEECRELGADARAWQRHMLDELCRLTGCKRGGSVEVRATLNGLESDFATAVDVGCSESLRTRMREFLTSGEYPSDDFCRSLSRCFVGSREVELTRLRQQLIDDSDWLRSGTWDAYRQLEVRDIVMSLVRIPGTDRVFCVGLNRVLGEPALVLREARVIDLCCRLIRPHLGRGLARSGDPGIVALSPRRRQVLAGLLEGLAEKQIAGRLGLSRPTVHDHVTDLYRYFDVGSRGELLALFLRRRNGPADEWLERVCS